jgi:FkbM family methyltransferase
VSQLILFGAGAAGHYAIKHLRAQGIEPLAFVDNDPMKQNTIIEGMRVYAPTASRVSNPAYTWVATAISRPAATEIRAEIKQMGVNTKPLWECLPVCHGLPPKDAMHVLKLIAYGDDETKIELEDQLAFRTMPDYESQRDPSDIKDIYFPDFIKHLDNESFVDVGAASGDTIEAFMERWPKFELITAFEPDRENFRRLEAACDDPRISIHDVAVGDVNRKVTFMETGDYSAHLAHVSSRDSTGGSEYLVQCVTLDGWMDEGCFGSVPTYIKMDIESAELEAIWGARRLLKDHSPVLAICAYHTSDHIWQIPLLIHAIQPEYRLYFRRYAEGAFEIIWYGVPPVRVK